jgi:uncharacterized protein YhbP (UPF0306 family)
MDLKKLLQQYFSENKLMQLATVSDGQPWLCNVYFVTDEDNNIYWTSARSRRHSKEISANPIVAGTVVHDGDKKQALQITGKAFEVSLVDAERIDKLYGAKFGDKDRLTEVLANLPDGRAYWMFKPDSIFFWDELHFPDSPKQEYQLP